VRIDQPVSRFTTQKKRKGDPFGYRMDRGDGKQEKKRRQTRLMPNSPLGEKVQISTTICETRQNTASKCTSEATIGKREDSMEGKKKHRGDKEVFRDDVNGKKRKKRGGGGGGDL